MHPKPHTRILGALVCLCALAVPAVQALDAGSALLVGPALVADDWIAEVYAIAALASGVQQEGYALLASGAVDDDLGQDIAEIIAMAAEIEAGAYEVIDMG